MINKQQGSPNGGVAALSSKNFQLNGIECARKVNEMRNQELPLKRVRAYAYGKIARILTYVFTLRSMKHRLPTINMTRPIFGCRLNVLTA